MVRMSIVLKNRFERFDEYKTSDNIQFKYITQTPIHFSAETIH